MVFHGKFTFQVFKTDNGDKSVPITWAYNHHFEAYLSGSYSELTKLHANEYGALHFHAAHHHGSQAFWSAVPKGGKEDPRPNSDIPTSQFFSEGNGGEFRYIS